MAKNLVAAHEFFVYYLHRYRQPLSLKVSEISCQSCSPISEEKILFSQKQGRLETWLIIWVFGDISYIPKYPFAQSLIASSRITKHQFTLTGLPKFKTEFSIDILLHCISAQS